MPSQNPHSPEDQQLNRSNDPERDAAMDQDAARKAMEPRNQVYAGSAQGVGSIAFDDPGAFDVGAGSEPRAFNADVAPGPLATGEEFRTEAEVADRDPGDGAGSLSPDQPGVSSLGCAGAENADIASTGLDPDLRTSEPGVTGPWSGGAGAGGAQAREEGVHVQSAGPEGDADATGNRNEQQDQLRQHAKAQSADDAGEGAPDQTRAQADFNGMNNQDSL